MKDELSSALHFVLNLKPELADPGGCFKLVSSCVPFISTIVTEVSWRFSSYLFHMQDLVSPLLILAAPQDSIKLGLHLPGSEGADSLAASPSQPSTSFFLPRLMGPLSFGFLFPNTASFWLPCLAIILSFQSKSRPQTPRAAATETMCLSLPFPALSAHG